MRGVLVLHVEVSGKYGSQQKKILASRWCVRWSVKISLRAKSQRREVEEGRLPGSVHKQIPKGNRIRGCLVTAASHLRGTAGPSSVLLRNSRFGLLT